MKEAYRQLDDKEVYEQVSNNASVLVNIIMKALAKIPLPGDLPKDILNYFLIQYAKFTRFCLLPKIHNWPHDVPGRQVISNCDYYTETISSILDYHLKPLAQKVKSYIKNTRSDSVYHHGIVVTLTLLVFRLTLSITKV